MTNTPAESQEGKAKHAVILVHGIRTHADWYIEVRDLLLAEGFDVGLARYYFFNLPQFLVPLPFFKNWAARQVERDIIAAMSQAKVDRVSVISHSFGTYVVAHILKSRPHIKFRNVIFCGSVVSYDFPFEMHVDRFQSPIINEVGTRDIWPILAKSVTWGYGDAGAFGFKRTLIHDRFHKGVSHSTFLNAKFCKKFWIPILRGEKPRGGDRPEAPPLWLRMLSVFHAKYIALILLAVWVSFVWCRAPRQEVFIEPTKIYFAGDKIRELTDQTELPCDNSCPEFLQCKRCMLTTSIDGSIDNLVLCDVAKTQFFYFDPALALEMFRDKTAACLEVTGVEDRRLHVRVNKSLASEVKTSSGRNLLLCGCDATATERALDIATGKQ